MGLTDGMGWIGWLSEVVGSLSAPLVLITKKHTQTHAAKHIKTQQAETKWVFRATLFGGKAQWRIACGRRVGRNRPMRSLLSMSEHH